MASFYHLARAPVAVKKKRKRAEGKSDNVLLFASHFIVVIFFCFILFLGGGGLVRTVRAWNLMLKCWKWQEEGNSRMFPIEWTNVHSRFILIEHIVALTTISLRWMNICIWISDFKSTRPRWMAIDVTKLALFILFVSFCAFILFSSRWGRRILGICVGRYVFLILSFSARLIPFE